MRNYSHGTIQRYEQGCRCILCEMEYLRYQRAAYECNQKTIKLPNTKEKKKPNA